MRIGRTRAPKRKRYEWGGKGWVAVRLHPALCTRPGSWVWAPRTAGGACRFAQTPGVLAKHHTTGQRTQGRLGRQSVRHLSPVGHRAPGARTRAQRKTRESKTDGITPVFAARTNMAPAAVAATSSARADRHTTRCEESAAVPRPRSSAASNEVSGLGVPLSKSTPRPPSIARRRAPLRRTTRQRR